MSNKHHGVKYRSYKQQMERTLPALQTRAVDLAESQGHLLGRWTPAKKKHGVGAQRTLCVSCGLGLTIMPRMWYKKGEVPAMKGEALFVPCCIDAQVLA